MNSHQLGLCSAEELLQGIQNKLQDRLSQLQDVFDRWAELRINPPTSIKGPFCDTLIDDVTKVVASLDGDFNLLKNLSAIIPPTHIMTCYPDNEGKVQYFALMSEYSGLRGGIYPALVANENGEGEVLPLELGALNFYIQEKPSWKELVDTGRRQGWLRCLLDLVTYEFEYGRLERVEGGSYLRRVQLDLVAELEFLPFDWDAELLVEDVSHSEAGEMGFKGLLGKTPVWVRYFSKENDRPEQNKLKALQDVIDTRNLRHPNIVSWFSVNSRHPDRWTLITPMLIVTLEMMLEAKPRSDLFKVAVMRDVVSGLLHLYRKETWHGKLSTSTILVSEPADPKARRFILSQFTPLTIGGTLEDGYRIMDAKGFLCHDQPGETDLKDHLSWLLFKLYPQDCGFDKYEDTYCGVVAENSLNKNQSVEALAMKMIIGCKMAPADTCLPRWLKRISDLQSKMGPTTDEPEPEFSSIPGVSVATLLNDSDVILHMASGKAIVDTPAVRLDECITEMVAPTEGAEVAGPAPPAYTPSPATGEHVIEKTSKIFSDAPGGPSKGKGFAKFKKLLGLSKQRPIGPSVVA